ncbi:hypothetical protein BDW22DRAFT_1372632 [Trametopsis cervina]|nr:hypothetical protein BDW22DRAFT_1372632 [Trametopsis cervina]
MSGLSSFFPSKLLGSMHPRDRSSAEPLARLRFALDTMPGSRKYVFTPATRAEILSELYDAFWGPYAHLFLLNSNSSLPLHALLSEVQIRMGASKEALVVPGRPCGTLFKKGEACFRCKDCALDESCVLCFRCFEATDHTNHNVSFFIAQQSGGSCDCGDFEAWRHTINCPHHPPSQEIADYISSFIAKNIPATPKVIPKVIPGSEVPPVRNYPGRMAVPQELHESMARTIGYAVDYVLDTLDFSPEVTAAPLSEEMLWKQPSGDPMMMKDQFCVVLWNDDKHSFAEVIQLLQDLTGRTREEASEVANKIDEQGRDIIEMNSNIPRLLDIGQTISQIELGVTVRRAYDTFREQVSAVIIEWLLDLVRCCLGSDQIILREIIAAELLSPRRQTYPRGFTDSSPIVADVSDPARIDWLLLYHTKLWKKPRLDLKEVYASLITLSHAHKLAIASHFANVYSRVIDAYLLTDREAETSIKYFALQLFTVPSVSLYLVRHQNIVSRLLSIITAFFTNQIQDNRIVYPPNPQADVDVDTFPFKSKRFMTIFSDLRNLCHNEPVQQLIAHNREFIVQFARTCQLFMCVNPNKRAASSHVEYETDVWISVFNVTLSLSRVIKVYGEAFSRSTVAELVSAITTVMHQILMVSAVHNEGRDSSRFPRVSFHHVAFGDTAYEVVDFEVMEGWVSFHHSLQWLLAELFKHVDILDDAMLQEVGASSLREVCLRNASVQAIQTIVDFPLRVIAMVAQIRAGLWVRNGFAIRGQVMHYRDFMLRELCYDQDLFILQTALVILDPNTVIVTMLDRFSLAGYFAGATLHHVYDNTQLANMVEEFLYVLITILTERANATKMPLPQAVRREIVHALALGPCTYTELIKRVAERKSEDICFDGVLKEVANFKPPESTSDSGLYELKDEAFDEVNPFFYHHTRNKREEVELVLRNRLKKKAGIDDPVLVPKPTEITHGPFRVLPAVFESEVLAQIMFYGVFNVIGITDAMGSAPPSAEAILDQSLHLIMLAIVERPLAFSTLAVEKLFEGNQTLIDVLCALEHNNKYSKIYKARIQWILSQIAQYRPHEVRARYTSAPTTSLDPEDAKKRAAKARQEALMKQMKAQQADFATNFNDMGDDDEDENTEDPMDPVSYGTCIVCQEELNSSRPFGSLGLVQPSRLLRRYPDTQSDSLGDVLSAAESLDHPAPTSHIPSFAAAVGSSDAKARTTNFEGFPPQFTRFGLHSSTCTHMMHLDCFIVYSASVRQRHRAQPMRNHPESIPRKEYICPLCKSLGNVIIPVVPSPPPQLNTTPFAEWIRSAGINILKSKPDLLLDSLQLRTGTGEFAFWAAQDQGYQSYLRTPDQPDSGEMHKMVDTLMVVAKTVSQQSRHLRDRVEPDAGERGSGMYLPEDLVGYTIACLEVSQRGQSQLGTTVADTLTDSQARMIRGLVACLAKLAALQFKTRPDEGRDAVRQAVIKRLLPEWTRSSMAYSFPLLLRDPFTILIEAAAVAPEMLHHILIFAYYAFLARTVVGLLYVLNKARPPTAASPGPRQYEDIFGDIRMFFMSVIRPSPVFEHAAEVAFQAFGDARIEKLLYVFTLPFLRRAAILCRAIHPDAFPSPPAASDTSEYKRLLVMLNIPPLSDLPNQETLQTALGGWCAHYGHSQAASQLNCGVALDYPIVYQIAKLPIVLDTLLIDQEKTMTCPRCKTVPHDAAICLMCGTTCCLQTHCCMDYENQGRGECNMHMRECSGPIGIYFCVKRCAMLYLYANNGTFGSPPYLDVHGEADMSMRRGRRQYLHQSRWEEIRRIWLNHGIPTLIARKLESTVDSGGWETM